MKLSFSVVGVASAAWTHVQVMDWDEFKNAYGMHFNGDEDAARHEIFDAKTAAMIQHNSEDHHWFQEQNQFSAMTDAEFVQFLNFDVSQSILNHTSLPVYEDYSDSLKGEVGEKQWTVSPVKNQGSCGSCWAFGAVAGMEGTAKIKLGSTTVLSEQQVMDCTSGSGACSGGRADSAYPQLYGSALYTQSSYPYTATGSSSCKSGTDSGLRISSFTRSFPRSGTDSQIASALDTNPLVVAVGASSWSSYGGGVYSDSSSCSLNHQVYATGYDGSSIKVKNSWGSSWGESGYIRLARSTTGCGTSGIRSDGGFYPTMSGSSVEV